MEKPHMDMKGATSASPSRRRLLSVIIPAYNAADTLGVQLDALKAQDYNGDWEIVVANNGSTDQTAEVVQNYQQSMPHLRLVHVPMRQNRSYARNMGVQEARGDAFLFCDADDVVAPGWVSALAEALEKHDVVFGAIEMQALNQYTRPNPYTRNAKVLLLDFLPRAVGGNFAISRKASRRLVDFRKTSPDPKTSTSRGVCNCVAIAFTTRQLRWCITATERRSWQFGSRAYGTDRPTSIFIGISRPMACRALQCERP